MENRKRLIREGVLAALCCLLLTFLADLVWGYIAKGTSAQGRLFGQAVLNSGVGAFLGYVLFFKLRRCRIGLPYFFLAYLFFELLAIFGLFYVLQADHGVEKLAFIVIFSVIRSAIAWAVVAVLQREQERHGTILPPHIE